MGDGQVAGVARWPATLKASVKLTPLGRQGKSRHEKRAGCEARPLDGYLDFSETTRRVIRPSSGTVSS